MQRALAIFPQAAVVIQPGKRALDNPAFWQYFKGMQLVALDDFDLGAGQKFHASREFFARVTPISHDFQQFRKLGQIAAHHAKRAVTIRQIRRADE